MKRHDRPAHTHVIAMASAIVGQKPRAENFAITSCCTGKA
jgi:hypothetical protein